MTVTHAILGPHNEVIEVDDIRAWSKMFEDKDGRTVAQDHLDIGGVRLFISTVFLGLNHGFGGVPLWFETMVFPEGDWAGDDMDRYTTWAEAKEGHARMLAKHRAILEANCTPPPPPATAPDTLRAIDRAIDIGDENSC